VRALNVEWTAGALPAWEIVLTWRNGHDPWHELLHAMQLSDPIPFDLTPMIFFLAQHALLPDGPQRAQAWAPHVQFYELGMMNLVMALIHEWAAVDERRAHIEAISQVVLDPELAKKAGICRTLLLALDADLSAIHATDVDGLDVELLKTFAQLGRLVWSTRMGSTIVGGLLRHPDVDTVALAGETPNPAAIEAALEAVKAKQPSFSQQLAELIGLIADRLFQENGTWTVQEAYETATTVARTQAALGPQAFRAALDTERSEKNQREMQHDADAREKMVIYQRF